MIFNKNVKVMGVIYILQFIYKYVYLVAHYGVHIISKKVEF